MKEKFEDLHWHDALINVVAIDRSNAGKSDTIAFNITWPNGELGTLTFHDVWQAQFSLNFGVIAEETILQANATKELPDALLKQWQTNGVDMSSIQCYEIETNSTASRFKIIAGGFSVV
ncbi:MAG: hypothetical protein EOO90_05260 [Pedobacter sp.]|nr:MAG: hypothetical protein EOO90_05260 [Pedobacter sp.]